MKKPFDLEDLKRLRALTVEQSAFYAATSRDIVLRWLQNGKLGYYVLPNTSSKKIQRRILREELERFLDSEYRKRNPRKIEYISRKRPELILLPREK